MSRDEIKKDGIDAAIDATKPEETVEEHQQVTLTLSSTKRHLLLSHPVDITEEEIMDLIGWVSTTLRTQQAQRRSQRSLGRLLVPVGTRLPTS